MERFGSVELGGTKILVALGTPEGELGPAERIETGGDPVAACARVVDSLRSEKISAIGISAFGPLDLEIGSATFGSLLDTPKPGWSGFDVLESIAGPLGVPAAIDTDVGGAALGEGRWGASQGLRHHAYVTVGTGIGAGVVEAGELIHGSAHPEIGHVAVRRINGDDFPGACPFHADCLEGMASGNAVKARYGESIDALAGEAQAAAVELIAGYIAQGIRALVYSVAPQRVVVGGGVSKSPGFHDKVRASLQVELAGYGTRDHHRSSGFVVPPGLGDRSGLFGGLELAARALARH